MPPQFSPTLSQPNAANSPQNFVPDEANQNERQGFAFENSLPPQFSSFPPSDGGNSQIGQEQFNDPGPFQNIEEGRSTLINWNETSFSLFLIAQRKFSYRYFFFSWLQ